MPVWFFRFLVPFLLLLLSALFLLLATRAAGALWGLAITVPLLAVAILDFVQKKHSLRRNYRPLPLAVRGSAALFALLYCREQSGRPAV